MARKAGLGFYILGGTKYTGNIWYPVKLERSGQTWDGPTGTATSFGTRVVCHRYYGSDFGTIMNGTILNPGSEVQNIFNGGHVPIISTGPGNYSSPGTWWRDLANGYADTQLKAFYRAVESLKYGDPVVPIPNVPGSDMGGTKPTEFIWVLQHEPNIPATKNGTPDEFAQAFYHIMTLYDSWFATSGFTTKHLKFAPIISNPAGTVANIASTCNPLYGKGTAHDCTTNAGSGRCVDYVGWDIYFPTTQNSSNAAPVAGPSYFGGKMTNLHQYVLNTFPANMHHIIGELGVRIQTGGTSPDATYPLKWWTDSTNGFIAWNNAHLLPNGDQPLAYVCSYAAGSLMNITNNAAAVNGGIDDCIIPDMNTYHAKNGKGIYFQNAGFSLRRNADGFYQALNILGNPSMSGGTNGVTPTLNTPTAPAAGATSVVITWTTNSSNASYNVYKDGVKTQSAVSAGTTTVYASSGSLPQTHTYNVTGVGTNGSESSLSNTITVNYTPLSGFVPNNPSAPTVPATEITTSTALFQTTAGAVDSTHGATTGYTWIIDGVTGGAPTSINPSYQASGLTAGGHTVAVQAFNNFGPSGTTSATSFTIPLGPDTTAPTNPGMPSYNSGTLTYKNVDLTWTASTDPTVSGQVTSGMLGYPLYRSTSPDFASATLINTPSTNSYKDSAPANSPVQAVDNYYWIYAEDNQRNITQSPVGPLKVTVPAVPALPNPTPVINFDVPSGQGQVGQVIGLDGSQSIPGSGGAIVSYSWDFGDLTSAQNSTTGAVQHIWTTSAQFSVTLTVTDVSGKSGTVVVPYIVAPSTAVVFPFINLAQLIAKTFATADQMNKLIGALDAGLSGHDARIGTNEAALFSLGSPLSATRHGLAYTSIPPETVGGSKTVVAGTAYVIRAYILNQMAFSNFYFHNVSTSSMTGLANTFVAIYDIDGNLLSPSGALTDQSSAIISTGNGVNVLPIDGAPFQVPVGTDALQDIPANQFYVYFYFGSVGANAPQISTASSYKFAINFGLNLGPVTPTAATVDQMPIFATASNGPTAALTPPTTLGQLTSFTDSLLIGLG